MLYLACAIIYFVLWIYGKRIQQQKINYGWGLLGAAMVATIVWVGWSLLRLVLGVAGEIDSKLLIGGAVALILLVRAWRG